MYSSSFKIPILLLLFNRPENAEKVLNELRTIKPTHIYVAIDGPRIDNTNDQIAVKSCIALINEIDWTCKIHTLIREKNHGCGPGVSSAINWFFEHVEMGIILEDDCIPAKSFFSYCEEMLIKYQHNTKVMHIAGTRWNEEFSIDDPYFFSSLSHIWGWATWRRAWKHYDFNMTLWPTLRTSDSFVNLFKSKKNLQYWIKTFDRFYNIEDKHTWDYQWQYTLFSNNGLAINPKVNLIENIGVIGSHTKNVSIGRKIHLRTVDNRFTVGKSAIIVQRNSAFDEYHIEHFFRWRLPLYIRIYRRITKLIERRLLI